MCWMDLDCVTVFFIEECLIGDCLTVERFIGDCARVIVDFS